MKKKISLLIASWAVAAVSQSLEPTTSWGGYGELHLNWKKTEDVAAKSPVLDFHRFVLFMGHAWTEEWSLKSEIEIEHNLVEGGTKKGELELEQAAVVYKPNAAFGFQAGVLLAPVGLLNVTHEPPTFLTVERSDYAKVIVPTTWFGNGLGFFGEVAGVQWATTLIEGINTAKVSTKNALRDGRNKGFEASTGTLLGSVRADYTALPSVLVGGSWSRNQLLKDDGTQVYNRIDLLELHAQSKLANIWATAEGGFIAYDPLSREASALRASLGGYIELGYDVASLWKASAQVVPFIQGGYWNTAYSLVDDEAGEVAQEVVRWTAGVAVLPISAVSFKVDAGIEQKGAKEVKTLYINAGAGYSF